MALAIVFPVLNQSEALHRFPVNLAAAWREATA
jgi:hypothetical protein